MRAQNLGHVIGPTGARGPKGEKGDKGDPGAVNVISASETKPYIFVPGIASQDISWPLAEKVIIGVTSVTSSNSNFTVTLTDVTESFIKGERTTKVNFKVTPVVKPTGITNFTITFNYKYLDTSGS